MPVLAARGLVKCFSTRRAIDGVDLELDAGEIRGLLGPNGAGKTTLLRLLLGLLVLDAGVIETFGISREPGRPPGVGVAGFVEEPAFYPYLSGRANLEPVRPCGQLQRADRLERVIVQVPVPRIW